MIKNRNFLLSTGVLGLALLVALFILWPKNKASSISSNFPLKLAWTFDANDRLLRPPRIAEDLVVINSSGGWPLSRVYYALEAGNGNLRWKYETSDELGGWYEMSWGAAAHKMILVSQTSIEAISLITGKRDWVSEGYTASISIDVNNNDDVIYVASRGRVTAVDAITGLEKWRNRSLPGYTLLAFYDPSAKIVVIPDEDKFYRIDAVTGQALPSIQIEKGYHCADWINSVRYYAGRVYCDARAFDALTGKIVSTGYQDSMNRWRPLIKSNIMYFVTGRGTIQAIRLDSFRRYLDIFSLDWEYFPSEQTGSVEIMSGVAVLDSTGYAIANDGTLRAFDISNGKEIGWWKSPDGVVDWRGSPFPNVTPLVGVVSDGQKLYASFGSKTLYAFEP